jgi:hypothetical protein
MATARALSFQNARAKRIYVSGGGRTDDLDRWRVLVNLPRKRPRKIFVWTARIV